MKKITKLLLFLAVSFVVLSAFEYKAEVKGQKVIFHFTAPDAKSVSVAGSFNNWDINADEMEGPDANGQWILEKTLPKGEYEYKYVVDKKDWIPEGYGNNLKLSVKGVERGKVETTENSITFYYDDPSAKQVQVAGSFNEWKPQDMQKAENGKWVLTVKVAPGNYEYKYLINGEWEPGNNRVVRVAKVYKYEFSWKAPGAKKVTLAGEFNGWNTDKIVLEGPDKDGVFKKVLELPAGRYEYKFLVDGNWIEGPNLVAEVGPKLFEVKQNGEEITFIFNDPQAKFVNVAGSFNDWAGTAKGAFDKNVGLMKKEDGRWILKLKLQPGEYEYKFVVNGEKWIGDSSGNNLKLQVK